jgi:5-methylcytosine-specific restriction endonuclease McrA
VHHIEHLDKRPDLALDNDNLESLCADCHNREHPEKFIEPSENAKTRIFPERW